MDQHIEFELAMAGLQLPAVAAGRDWPAVLSGIRSKIAVLAREPLIAGDPGCTSILMAMQNSGSMPDFAARVDELAYRVAWLLREMGDEDATQKLSKTVRAPSTGMSNTRPHALEETDAGAKAARTRFRL